MIMSLVGDAFNAHIHSHNIVLCPLFSCASDSALADHCGRLQIIFTYLLTYLLTLLAG